MKKFLALVFFVLNSPSVTFAESCIDTICVGNTVIDSSQKVGRVIGIIENKLVYQVNGFEYRAEASQLSKEITDPVFTVGIKVMDSGEKIGTVSKVFENRSIVYIVNGFTYTSKTLSPEVQSYGDLSSGTEVLDSSEKIGRVSKMFADGRTQYVVNGFSYITNAMNLSKLIETLNGLTAGSSVIDSSEKIGTVRKIFKNSKVQYVVNGFTYMNDAPNLSLEVNVLGALSVGAQVIDTSDKIGAVKRLFANNKVQYIVNGFTYMNNANQLFLEVSSLDELAVAKSVIDRSEKIGVVKRIFSNKRVQYVVNGFTYMCDVNQISPEVDTHPTYKKEETYASGTYIGKISKIFSNGKMVLRTDGGMTSVNSQFSKETSLPEGMAVGTELVASNTTKVKALRLFENQTIEVEVAVPATEWSQAKTYKKGVQFISDPTLLTKNDLLEYSMDIYNYYYELEQRNMNHNLHYASSAEVLTQIKQRISANFSEFKKDYFTDTKIAKKVSDYLSAIEGSAVGTTSTPEVEVKLDNAEYEEAVGEALALKNISFAFESAPEGKQILDIKVDSAKGFPLNSCSIVMEYASKTDQFSQVIRHAESKSAVGNVSKLCKKLISKMIAELALK